MAFKEKDAEVLLYFENYDIEVRIYFEHKGKPQKNLKQQEG